MGRAKWGSTINPLPLPVIRQLNTCGVPALLQALNLTSRRQAVKGSGAHILPEKIGLLFQDNLTKSAQKKLSECQ